MEESCNKAILNKIYEITSKKPVVDSFFGKDANVNFLVLVKKNFVTDISLEILNFILRTQLFHDGGRYDIETSSLICINELVSI